MKRYLLDGSRGCGLLPLRGAYGLRKESAGASERTYYDSADGRLFARGWVLCSEDRRLELARERDGRPIAEAAVAAPVHRLFWWDLGDDRLSQRLRRALDVRAATPRARVRRLTTVWRVLDREQKTVARLAVTESLALSGDAARPVARVLELRGVKGYRKELGRLAARLERAGLREPPQSEYALAMRALGVEPQRQRARAPEIKPQWPAERAARSLLHNLLSEMRRLEEGIVKDIDTEFLHEFRIAVRKVRVLTAQLAAVFVPEADEAARTDFAIVGRITSRLRDLDVILLNARDYRAKVPEDLAPALDGFFARLRVARREELAAVAEALTSDPYLSIVSRWEAALARPFAGGRKSRVPAARLVGKLVRKRLARLRRLLGSLGKRTAAADLHRLRIECKKLRYLTEGFASLFPGGALGPLEKQLRLLQQQLGRQHDLAVQQSTLRACLAQMESMERDDLEMAAAIGALTAELRSEQEALERGFRRSLSELERRARAARVARLLDRKRA